MDSAQEASMPWKEVSIVDQRQELVRLAMQEGANRRELFRRFGVHPNTGYKWLGRGGAKGRVTGRLRRPPSRPGRAEASVGGRGFGGGGAPPARGGREDARPP